VTWPKPAFPTRNGWLILAHLARYGEAYGVQIQQATGLVGGSLYPVLARLEHGGLVVRRVERGPYGPDRHYWTLTPRGALALQQRDPGNGEAVPGPATLTGPDQRR
jgi:DNA-binding PadR family transcriptional regulator